MTNNKREKASIFNKIKLFFKRIFNMNFNQKLLPTDNTEIQNDNQTSNTNFKTDFLENIKTNVSDEYNKEFKLKAFIKELEGNPDLVENLSDDRLDKLIAFYEKMTNEKAEKIKRLKGEVM